MAGVLLPILPCKKINTPTTQPLSMLSDKNCKPNKWIHFKAHPFPSFLLAAPHTVYSSPFSTAMPATLIVCSVCMFVSEKARSFSTTLIIHRKELRSGKSFSTCSLLYWTIHSSCAPFSPASALSRPFWGSCSATNGPLIGRHCFVRCRISALKCNDHRPTFLDYISTGPSSMPLRERWRLAEELL